MYIHCNVFSRDDEDRSNTKLHFTLFISFIADTNCNVYLFLFARLVNEA